MIRIAVSMVMMMMTMMMMMMMAVTTYLRPSCSSSIALATSAMLLFVASYFLS